MVKCNAFMTVISFNIPDWFPPDRFEYNKGEPTYEYGNKASNLFDKTFDWYEMHNWAWVSFEYKGSLDKLPEWIEQTQSKLEKFFSRYKEAKQ